MTVRFGHAHTAVRAVIVAHGRVTAVDTALTGRGGRLALKSAAAANLNYMKSMLLSTLLIYLGRYDDGRLAVVAAIIVF